MLLIIISGTVTILCLAVGFAVDKYSKWSDGFGWKIASLIFGVLFALATLPAIHMNLTKEAFIASNEQRYNSLVYQFENDIYDNDNDLGKKELMKEIQDWNEDLASAKAMATNKWFGAYYPKEVFDHFDFIKVN